MARKNLFPLLATLFALVMVVGCSSSSTAPTSVDTAPPAMPTGLTAEPAADGVVISWDPNTTDADLAGFIVERTVRGSELMLIEEPTDVTECVDPAPIAGYENIYSVSAVDLAGNLSAYATITVTLPSDEPRIRPADGAIDDESVPGDGGGEEVLSSGGGALDSRSQP